MKEKKRNFEVKFEIDENEYWIIANDIISGFCVSRYGIHKKKPEKGVVFKAPKYYYGRLDQALNCIVNKWLSDQSVEDVKGIIEKLKVLERSFKKFDSEFRSLMLSQPKKDTVNV